MCHQKHIQQKKKKRLNGLYQNKTVLCFKEHLSRKWKENAWNGWEYL